MAESPQQVGPYEIVAPLGEGGMGRVFRARDPRLNRDVAVKLLPAEFSADRNRRQRFEQEARAVAALNHPGIVSVYDVGEGWMVTELVEGRPLRGLELSTQQVIDIGAQIADALAAAHEAGITHRDLKPENILLTHDGRTKILDFGLAKRTETEHSSGKLPRDIRTVTNPGTATGTPGYMAPEQVRGQPTDHRADMFSLGVVLYELLAGKPAFEAPSAVEVMHAIVHQDVAELPDSVPAGLRAIIKRCLEKNPSKRFQSARDLAFALRALSGSPAPAQPAAPTRSSPWSWPLLAGLAIAAVAMFAVFRPGGEPPAGADLSAYQFHPFAATLDQEHSGVWSPDGQSIAFLQESPEGVRLMLQSVDAPAPTRLANQVSASAGQLAWSPDGTRVYFLRSGGGLNGVFEVSTAGGIATPVLVNPAGGGFQTGRGRGRGAPQGESEDGRGPGLAAKGRAGVAGLAGGNVAAFHLSPDGQSMALWRGSASGDEGAHYSVWISSPVGSEPVEYTPAPFAVRTPFVPVYLRFSPDSSKLFLSMYTDQGAETWLLPFPAGSGEPRQIFAGVPWNRPVSASWMPDSRRLVLSGNPAPSTGEQLWLADVESETMTRILAWPGGGQATPSVSPDGRRLLFSAVTRDRDIVELPLDGSPPRKLLSSTLSEFGPSWSPQGDQFAYVTRRNGTPELWVRSPEGLWDRPVVTAREFPTLETLISPIFSPDGSRIAYTALLAGGGRRRSLAISPAAGGAPTVIANGYAATWSPGGGAFSGAAIAFLWLKEDGTLPIARLRLGSDEPPVEILTGGGLDAPEWSPSGEWIAVPSPRGIELVSGSPFGERQRRRLEGIEAQAVAWSSDSATIYGLDYQGSPPTLRAVDAASGESRIIAEYPGLTFEPLLETVYTGSIRLSMAPDGQSLATATASNQSDLWILDGFAK